MWRAIILAILFSKPSSALFENGKLFGSAHTVNTRVVGAGVDMTAGSTPAAALDTAKTLSSREYRITLRPPVWSSNRWWLHETRTNPGLRPLHVALAPAIAMDSRYLVPQ